MRAAAELARPGAADLDDAHVASPYVSPNSAIAPDSRASSSVMYSRGDRQVGAQRLVGDLLDVLDLLEADSPAVQPKSRRR